MPIPSVALNYPESHLVLMRHLFFAGCLVGLLLVGQGCSTVPRYKVEGEFQEQTVSTSVDSQIARYYLEHYLQGERTNPHFDEKIDSLYQNQRHAQPTREELKDISRIFSVDFATLFLADRLWSIEKNHTIQKAFRRFLDGDPSGTDQSSSRYSSYTVLFVPGWDYVEHGHLTGADLAAPRKLVTDLGIENHLIEISPHGSVEENADDISKEIVAYSQTGKNIIISGPSSAGPAIHVSLGEQLSQDQLQHVKAWVNLGGLLQGTSLIGYLYEWPRSWVLAGYMWMRGWEDEELMSMAVEPSRKRFERLTVSDHILIVNFIGFPLSGQLSRYARDKYPLLAPDGPNDGLTLLTDAIAPDSMTIISLGGDHFLAEDPQINEKTVALARTVISYLEKENGGSILDH